MKTDIVISKELAPLVEKLESVVRNTLEKARQHLQIGDITIEIVKAQNVEVLKDINGIGAYCPSGDYAQLSLDIEHPSLQGDLETIVQKSLLHELHHAARRQAGINMEKSTLLECLVTEGLADCFVYEVMGELPIWTDMLTSSQEKQLKGKIQTILEQSFSIDLYKKWFIEGNEKNNIPRFAGYALGYGMVKDFLQKHSDKTAASVVTISAQDLVS